MARTDRKSIFLKTLLLALVLAVQVLGHAHAVDHGPDSDTNLCSICSVSGHGGHAVVDSGGAEDIVLPRQATPVCTEQVARGTSGRTRHARAPPRS